MTATVSGLLLAAGSGSRIGDVPKARLTHRGETLLVHGVRRMLPHVDELVVAVGADHVVEAEAELAEAGLGSGVRVVAGGDTRQESLARLLEAAEGEWVLVHEVARPLTPPEAFTDVLEAAAEAGAAVLCAQIPARDSIGVAENDRLARTLSRSSVVSLQTPHVYRRMVLLEAYARARAEGWTEEGTAALAVRAGIPVRLVETTSENLKITYPEDLERLSGQDA